MDSEDTPTGFYLRRGSKPRGASKGFHVHGAAQLMLTTSGSVQLATLTGSWLAPPLLAVWVPAGELHRVDVLSDAESRMLYWTPEAVKAWAPRAVLRRAFALRVTPLLRALVDALFAAADRPAASAELAARLILHELEEVPDAPTFLPMPTGAVGRRVAELALTDTRLRWDLAEVASRAATSPRTVSRLFPAETGLSFKAWRQRARIVAAIDHLSAGRTTSEAADRTGFASTAAFCHAFRQVTGTTPGAFVERC